MGQHDTCGTASCNDVQETIAFGSMLVFASVMPPLDPDTIATGVQGMRKRATTPDTVAPGPAGKPAAQSRKRFDS